jgi:hypothetical protein
LGVSLRLVILLICVQSVKKYGVVLVVAGLAAKKYTHKQKMIVRIMVDET